VQFRITREKLVGTTRERTRRISENNNTGRGGRTEKREKRSAQGKALIQTELFKAGVWKEVEL